MATVEVLDTDITRLEVDAIANAANTDLLHGGGVAGAISRAGGPKIDEESRAKAPIALGEATHTTAGEMPSRYVIHAATMRLGGPTSAEVIRQATRSTLEQAEQLGDVRSLALVAFGTGVGGFPLQEAADIEADEVARHLERRSGLERIVFAVHGARARDAFERAVRSAGLWSALDDALDEAGGADAPTTATAGLRKALVQALEHGRAELARKRSGYEEPVLVAIARHDGALLGVAPVPVALRADTEIAGPRAWTVVAALVGALAESCTMPPPGRPDDLRLRAGDLQGNLLLQLASSEDPDLAVLAFEERLESADRLRARAVVVPAPVLVDGTADLRDPIGPSHPLRVAEAVARLGGDPTDPDAPEALEDVLGVVLGTTDAHARPHEDPDPARRVARRILQRLAGMGKWGGYHTEFAHLPRGFAGNDRALAMEVGEALLSAGLLLEKPSVGQRHVYLNPRRAKDVYGFIDEGRAPPGLLLPTGSK